MANKSWARKTVGGSNAENNRQRVSVLDGFHTPPVAVTSLLAHEGIHDNVWEPAAGFHKIANVLREYDYNVFTSDIYDWSSKTHVIKDFMKWNALPKRFDGKPVTILTNPPFKHAQAFVEQSMKLLSKGDKLCLLLRVQFLEGQKRYAMFERFPPRRIWIFSFRLPYMRRFLYHGKETGSTLAFAWFVFVKGYSGATEVKWIGKPD